MPHRPDARSAQDRASGGCRGVYDTDTGVLRASQGSSFMAALHLLAHPITPAAKVLALILCGLCCQKAEDIFLLRAPLDAASSRLRGRSSVDQLALLSLAPHRCPGLQGVSVLLKNIAAPSASVSLGALLMRWCKGKAFWKVCFMGKCFLGLLRWAQVLN